MRAQIYAELADLAEERGDQAEAERLHQAGIAVLEANYPGSSALLSARGRLASFYARTGRADQAAVIFRSIVAAVGEGAEAHRPCVAFSSPGSISSSSAVASRMP
jgi:hypothetical protein